VLVLLAAGGKVLVVALEFSLQRTGMLGLLHG
jgi:hypothetical protein